VILLRVSTHGPRIHASVIAYAPQGDRLKRRGIPARELL
jgi:hypothetical protein